MKNLITLVSIAFLGIGSLNGQDPWSDPDHLNHENDVVTEPSPRSLDCDQSSPDYENKYNRYSFYLDNYDKHPVVTIPINLVFWQKDDGSENWQNEASQIARLDQIIAWLNGFYSNNCAPSDPISGVQELPDTKIRFVADYHFYQNTAMWGQGSGGSSSAHTLNAEFAALNPGAPKRLNVHVTGGSFMNAAGFAVFPQTNLNQSHYVVTFNNGGNPIGDYAWAGHLAHELGHNLDLQHTYGGICNQSNPDYHTDIFNSGPCPHDAGFDCEPLSADNTCTNNVMGGTKYACYFSPTQIARMHRALALKSIRNYVLCEEYDANPIIVNSHEKWDFNIKFYNPITIKAGSSLELSCNLEMSKNHKIIVENSAKLTVNGGTITSKCGFWSGIELWGNHSLTQSTSNQGYVTTRNDATIEYAKNAISTIKNDNGTLDWSKTGGIIRCSNTTFLNNWKSVEYLYYHANHPTLPGVEIPNQGRFTDCDFIWDENYISNTLAPAITMYHVNGVQVLGCHFIDNRDVDIAYRATGIYTIDAGFKVLGQYTGGGLYYPPNFPQHNDYDETDYNVSYFNKLLYGIHAMNSSASFPITVDHTKFENNKYGILLDAVDNAVITRNMFDYNLNHPVDMTQTYQLTTRECTGYQVEGNEFYRSSPWSAVGTLVENSGPQANQIYRNYYDGLNVGNWGRGFNSNDLSSTMYASGLQWKCNKNQNGYIDMYNQVTSYDPALDGEGVRAIQGSMHEATGNLVSPTIGSGSPGSDLHFYNGDQDAISYYYGADPDELPTETQGLFLTSAGTSHSCPSTFMSDIVVSKDKLITKSQYSTLQNQITSIDRELEIKQDALDKLLADGDAQYLHDLVAGLTDQNKSQIKATLLAKSPYLSLSLLKELGGKHPRLFPHTWYREVIHANIEVARNDAFLETLLTKTFPIPTDIYDSIRKTRFTTFTERGKKELAILKLYDQREVLLNLFIADAMSGENEINWQTVEKFITSKDHIENKRQLVDHYLSRNDIANCNSILNHIESQLSSCDMNRVKNELEDFILFKRYFLTITDSSGIVKQLLPSEIEQLKYMAYNFEGKAARQAQNVLCFHANLCDEINYTIPEPFNKENKSLDNRSQEEIEIEALQLKIAPNPNDGTFKLIVPEECVINEITIYNVTGKKVQFALQNVEGNNAVVRLNDVENGIYSIHVSCAGGVTYLSRTLVTR